MNTIKFQYKVLLNPTDEDGKYVDNVSLYEGYDIQHRPFLVNSKEEYADWFKEFGGPASNVVHHYINSDPAIELDQEDFKCYFHYLIFMDDQDQMNKCIVFCAECFIMNEQGQTIDSFNA